MLMFIITLMQVLGIISLCASAFLPLAMIAVIADAVIRGAKDFKHRGTRALYRLFLLPIAGICLNLALPALFELANLLYYMFL